MKPYCFLIILYVTDIPVLTRHSLQYVTEQYAQVFYTKQTAGVSNK